LENAAGVTRAGHQREGKQARKKMTTAPNIQKTLRGFKEAAGVKATR
jgi:hypothetical protein